MEKTPCVGAGTDCVNRKHDHRNEDGSGLVCEDCGQALHYDAGVEDYAHDDPAAPDCFLRHKWWTPESVALAERDGIRRCGPRSEAISEARCRTHSVARCTICLPVAS